MDSKKALSKSNQIKVLSGAELKKQIIASLDNLLSKEVIKSFEVEKSFKHKDYSYEKQYLINFFIETLSGQNIIVRSANSARSDRIKTGLYDLHGVLNYTEYGENVIASIYLVSDSELSKPEFLRIQARVLDGSYFSPASHFLTLSEFVTFLEGFEGETLKKKEDEFDEKSSKEKGSFYGKSGNAYEKYLVEILSNPKNLALFKNNEKPPIEFLLIVKKLIKDKKIDVDHILQIKATNSIPLLKNGGSPKTDIKLEFYKTDGAKIIETISIKNTTAPKVSCHDYTAEGFINVLGCEGTELADQLRLFQKFPSYDAFNSNAKPMEGIDSFKQNLLNKQDLLTEWVLMGKHDIENLVLPQLQTSNYILLHNPQNEKITFYFLPDYIQLLKSKRNEKLGVPFSWTYPSKQRGKRIQLKMAVFFE